jgi:hypothetical protein
MRLVLLWVQFYVRFFKSVSSDVFIVRTASLTFVIDSRAYNRTEA